MNPSTLITTLLSIGVQVKDAWTKSGKDWKAFLGSEDFGVIASAVEELLGAIKPDDMENALRAVRTKETALLKGRSILALSVDELSQFHALSDVEHQLASKLLKATPKSQDFLGILVHDVLPSLISVAKIVVPLLL